MHFLRVTIRCLCLECRLYGVEIVEGATSVESACFTGHACAFMMGNEGSGMNKPQVRPLQRVHFCSLKATLFQDLPWVFFSYSYRTRKSICAPVQVLVQLNLFN